MFRPPSYQELYETFRREMERVGFNHWAEGSRIGAIGKVIAAYLSDLWLAIRSLQDQTNPSTATGAYLDRIGETFGVRRLPAQVATSLGKGSALKWTNNGSTTIGVPAGTRVWNPTQPEYAFFTLNSLSLGPGEEGYVDVQAAQVGENYNVGVGVLTNHNAGMSQLSVTNIRPLGGGTLSESDDSYRYRISLALKSRDGNTEVAIRSRVLGVPGVRDVVVRNLSRGNGSLDVVVIPVDRYASPALLDAVRSEVAQVVSAGISWQVSAPPTKRIDLQIQLRLLPGVTINEVRAQVESAARGYLDNLRIHDGRGGSELIYNELVSRVMDASNNIVDSYINVSVDGVPALQANVTPDPGFRLVSGAVSVL